MNRILIVEAAAQAAHGLPAAAVKAFPSAQWFRADAIAEAVCLMCDEAFDLVLLDPQGLADGAPDVSPVVQALRPSAKLVIFTHADGDERLLPALRAGAFGYLLKSQPEEELVAALRGAAQGEPPLAPTVARRVLRFFIEDFQATVPQALSLAPEDVALNPRETEILQRVAKGFTLPEIAGQLGLSRHTVADYVKQIYRKLNVSSRAEAALEAARRGLVRP